MQDRGHGLHQLLVGSSTEDNTTTGTTFTVRFGVFGFGFFNDAMVIGTTKSKRRNTSTTWHARMGHKPWSLFGIDVDRCVLNFQIRLAFFTVLVQYGWFVAIDGFWNRFVFNGQNRFDETGHAGT